MCSEQGRLPAPGQAGGDFLEQASSRHSSGLGGDRCRAGMEGDRPPGRHPFTCHVHLHRRCCARGTTETKQRRRGRGQGPFLPGRSGSHLEGLTAGPFCLIPFPVLAAGMELRLRWSGSHCIKQKHQTGNIIKKGILKGLRKAEEVSCGQPPQGPRGASLGEAAGNAEAQDGLRLSKQGR